MAKKKFTVVINGDGGYHDYQVKAVDWKEASAIANATHRVEWPNDAEHEIGTAAVIAGWPKVWA